MKKLSSEDKKNLLQMLDKLDKLDGKDSSTLKEDLAEITNEFSNVVNKKPYTKQVQEVIELNEPIKEKSEKIQNENRIKDEEFEESEQILDDDLFLDVLKSSVEQSQYLANMFLTLLENANDKQAKSIKKCYDNMIENKRLLKNIYKDIIDIM